MTLEKHEDRVVRQARRDLMETQPNPDPSHDYLSTLSCQTTPTRAAPLQLQIRYVPDRLIVTQAALDHYLSAFNGLPIETAEHAALTLLEDVNDVLIPRWIEISVTVLHSSPEGNHLPFSHAVTVEDRQPGWDNSRLIARLGSI